MNKSSGSNIRFPKWRALIAMGTALLVVTAVFAGSAEALTTGSMSAIGVTIPISNLWLPGALSGHSWVSDSALGFCRLDPGPNATTAQLNQVTCVKAGSGTAGQAAFDPIHNFVYMADASANSQGVYRMNYDPKLEIVSNPVLLAAGQLQGGPGPRALALGPDNRLYVGLNGSGQIVRITNPAGTSQGVEFVGFTSNSLPASWFSFIGSDLYIAETLRVSRIVNAAACFSGTCNPAVVTDINVLAPTAIAYDGNTNLFVSDYTTVTTYNPVNGTQSLYAVGGVTNGITSLFNGISSLTIDLQGNLQVGENPSRTALGGHIWSLTPAVIAENAPGGDVVRPLASLKTVKVPEPSNLMDFVADRQAAIQLGKTLFWDTQVGSDGKTACASCHFQAGADMRSKNQLNPGLRGDDPTFQLAGPNHQLLPLNFPLTKHQDPGIPGSPIVSDYNDVVSSQGVMLHVFGSIASGNPVENCTYQADSIFKVGSLNVRRVAPRNAPAVVNAVFNLRNFWDGRASDIFNGVNPFGQRDPNATIWKYDGVNAVPVTIAIDNASLASQAVGPPGSSFEMSCDKRSLADIGRKLINSNLKPLGFQYVDPNDSVLGIIANSRTKKGSNGLKLTYRDLIQKAFRQEYWAASKVGDQKYSQMEANFSLFFGLSVQMYEATLVSNNTPFDQFMEGNTSVLTQSQQNGLALFVGQANCITCHAGPELTKAATANAGRERIERMIMGDGGCAAYDNGFYNIGVRPTAEDLGLGGTDPFGNPLSDVGMASLGLFTDPNLLGGFGASGCDARLNVDGTFKVPSLRNVELTGPYFHNGGQATLWHVIDFYNRGGDYGRQNINNVDPFIQNLNLTDAQKTDLVNFLLSLTDERVRWEKAPFDHPALCVPNGQSGDTSKTTETRKGSGEAVDVMLCLPATGVSGGTKPLVPFLGMDPMSR